MNQDLNTKIDYSKIVPTLDRVVYVIEYMGRVYEELERLINEDEEKNKKFSSQYKDYKYKSNYKKSFTIFASHKDYDSSHYNNINDFTTALGTGKFKNLTKVRITLNMSFKRGKEDDFIDHDHEIILNIEPYNVTLSRESKMDDIEANEVFNTLKALLDSFDKQDTIFNI